MAGSEAGGAGPGSIKDRKSEGRAGSEAGSAGPGEHQGPQECGEGRARGATRTTRVWGGQGQGSIKDHKSEGGQA
eukprot:1152043-Pelagomonas_calceolata.AAC.5